MNIVSILSRQTLIRLSSCFFFLLLIATTSWAQSLNSGASNATASGPSASITPGGPAAQLSSAGVLPLDVGAPPPTVDVNLAANPAALSGPYYSGLLQQAIGLRPDFPVKFGGILDLGGNWLASGGIKPNSTSGDFVFGLNVDVDAETLLHIPGGEFFTAFVEYQGGNSNGQAGSVQIYDNLAPPKDFQRTELYELWWRQRLFHDKLIVKIGKTNAGGEFGQVLTPVPIAEANLQDWTISDLLYTPSGYMPTFGGKLPVYQNTAWGMTVSLLPTTNFYVKYGLFDGNGARGVQTGVNVGPKINSYKFHIGEAGYAWRLSDQGKPGRFAAGVWGQTGELATGNLTLEKTPVMTNGAIGYYAFGSQRLWYRHPGTDPSGLVGFLQLGYTDSRANTANWYVGSGLTALSLVPGRPGDSMGVGLAWSKLNPEPYAAAIFLQGVPSPFTATSLRSSELMLQAYYQLNVISTIFAVQAAYTAIPTPGYGNGIPWANIFTLRMVVVL